MMIPTNHWILPPQKLDFTDSTNTRLKEDDHPAGTLLYTLDQRAGRGRLGRSWVAPAGSSLAFSVLLPPHLLDEDERQLLPLCAALAVQKTLSSLCGRQDFLIKWPNDILCSGRKICGILCETVTLGDQIRTVCGVGINLTQTPEEFQKEDLPHAVSLATVCPEIPSVEDILETFARSLEAVLETLRQGDRDTLLVTYARHSATLGRAVRVLGNRETLIGIAEGLSPEGGLLVRTDHGVHCVSAGEVSVRGVYGELF